MLGIGGSVLWGTATYYVMQISQRHAKEKKKDVVEITSDFFGKFYAIMNLSLPVSTIIMTVVFEVLDQEVVNTTVPITLKKNSTNGSAESACGLYHKLPQPEDESYKLISDVATYVVLSVFLAFNVVAAVLCLCIDEVSGTEATDWRPKDETTISFQPTDQIELTDTSIRKSEMKYKEEATQSKQDGEVLYLLRCTIKLLLTDKTAMLLSFFTLNFGMLQGFLGGVFNASWITCQLGKL